jgi:hypothetical protein
LPGSRGDVRALAQARLSGDREARFARRIGEIRQLGTEGILPELHCYLKAILASDFVFMCLFFNELQ